MYKVLLYYFYNAIENVDEKVKEHRAFCQKFRILGRVFITKEGINGTVSGLEADIATYKKFLEDDPLFKGLVFKESTHPTHTFKKLKVKNKNELVNLSLEDDVNPLEVTGRHIKPSEFCAHIDDDDTVIIDARNTYEHAMGHFKGAIKPDIETFRELPNWVRENRSILEGKKIIAYCTGGVRCEKFTGWLIKEGFNDVAQLDGGIQTYGASEETHGEHWLGSMYVFDERIEMPINHVNPVIIAKDHYTQEPCQRMFNCANPECNKKLFGHAENEHAHLGGCSRYCTMHPRNRYVKHLDPAEKDRLLKKCYDPRVWLQNAPSKPTITA